jgi:hypothetical protein
MEVEQVGPKGVVDSADGRRLGGCLQAGENRRRAVMTFGADPRQGDHALGIELQLGELVEQRARALAQGDDCKLARLAEEIATLQTELAQASGDE